MNTKPSPRGKFLVAICASALLLAGSLNSPAADGTWTNVNGGNWSDPLNWLGGTVADGEGSKADFSTVDLTAFPMSRWIRHAPSAAWCSEIPTPIHPADGC